MAELSNNDKIFLHGLKIENIIEYIESKVLDAFFGHKHELLENASNLMENLISWIWRLKQEIKLTNFLSQELTNKILIIIDKIEDGAKNMKVAVENDNYEAGNYELEKILRAIRDFYNLRTL